MFIVTPVFQRRLANNIWGHLSLTAQRILPVYFFNSYMDLNITLQRSQIYYKSKGLNEFDQITAAAQKFKVNP